MISKTEYSFGIIAIQSGKILVVLNNSPSEDGKDVWTFCKGHAYDGEAQIDAAKRELREETSLVVKQLLNYKRWMEQYTFERNGFRITKKLYFWIGEVDGKVQVDNKEIRDYKWVSYDEVESTLTFDEDKELAKQIVTYLKN